MIFAILVAILKQIGLDKSKEGELKPTVQDFYFWLANKDIKNFVSKTKCEITKFFKSRDKENKNLSPKF